MKDTKLRLVWNGQKTFKILQGFNYQGVAFYPNNLFTCNSETYNDYKKFLGEEYIPAETLPDVEKPKPKKEIKKEEVKKEKPKTDKESVPTTTPIKKVEKPKTKKRNKLINRIFKK